MTIRVSPRSGGDSGWLAEAPVAIVVLKCSRPVRKKAKKNKEVAIKVRFTGGCNKVNMANDPGANNEYFWCVKQIKDDS